jgi:chemotaxis protein MotB
MVRIAAIVAALGLACSSKPASAPEPPKQDERVAALERELREAKDALAKEQGAAAALRTLEAEKAAGEKALQDKLAEAVGRAGEVTTADGAVKLELVDQILFATGEADLTATGREVLAKVGAALKEVDKQIWVQGHTDNQPIYVKKPAGEPKPPAVDAKRAAADAKKPGKKPPTAARDKKPADGSDAVLAYVTNWELSAARALTVVHYLQDEAKLDPARLAAVAFGQYRPVSRAKAKNRRIEIVLYPRVAIAPR